MLNKYDLAKKIFDEYELNGALKKQVVPTVEALFDALGEIVASGESINIVGFGQFSPYIRKEHVGKHPQSDEKITVPAVHSIKFKPSSVLREKIENNIDNI